jgi:hypothetical protein
MSEKDRLGEKLEERRRAEEERYFEQQNRAAIERLRAQKAAGTAPATPAMRCPRDAESLIERKEGGITIDVCPKCEGVWLDKGEIEQLAGRERGTWLGRLVFGAPKS